MKLYEIAQNYREVAGLDDPEKVKDTLDMIEGEFTDKASNILAIIQNGNSDLAALELQISRLSAMKKSITSVQDKLKDYLRHNMEATGITKIEHPLFKVSLGKGQPVCEVMDVEQLPDQFVSVRQSITPDKKAILSALKQGEQIPGAKLSIGKSKLTIK